MTQWRFIRYFLLYGITEEFNVDDFCELVRKGYFKIIHISFASNISATYRQSFKNAVKEMKETWTSEIEFPMVTMV